MRQSIPKIIKKLNTPLILMLFLVMTFSCKNEAKNTQETTNKEFVSDPESSEQEKLNTKEEKGYTNQLGCNSFFESIDFSSLCASETHTPEYQLKSPDSGNICKYDISFSETDNLVLFISYVDYNGGGFSGRDKPEKVKKLMQQSFTKRKKNTNRYTNYEDVNIGDEAYFASNKASNLKSLHIRLSNVEVYIEVNDGNSSSCIVSDKELLKLGNLVISNIKE